MSEQGLRIQNVDYSTGVEHIIVNDWHIMPNQHWVVFSTYSHSGSTFARILSGELTCENMTLSGAPASIGSVSLSLQQALLEYVIANDDSEALGTLDISITVDALVMERCESAEQRDSLLKITDITHLRHKSFRLLSTGETRRLMLARALAIKPQLLILDEPYSGLDNAHQHALSTLLNKLSAELQIIIITSRDDEIPTCITHVTMFSYDVNRQTQAVHSLNEFMTIKQWHAHPVMAHLQLLSQQRSDEVMALIKRQRQQAKYPDPLVTLKDCKVQYSDGVIFKGVNWQINNAQHWQIRGPNGCGKSSLLGLILGDHPQCYCNDITLFGKVRGSGETIWQVKKEIGVVSATLHLQHRVNCSAIEVIMSGFFDSIGLYQRPNQQQLKLAQDWLAILHMSQFENVSFKQLDYGQQRLLIIGRSLIKQPILLILDEPYQGLDFINRKLLMNTLNMLANENLSQLLYVSHHPDDALPAIKNYVDFVGEARNGYEAVISTG